MISFRPLFVFGCVLCWHTEGVSAGEQGDLRAIACHDLYTSDLAFSPDGRTLATCGSGKAHAQAWDLRSGERVRAYGSGGEIRSQAAFSPDGRWIASAGKDKRITIWRLDGKVETILEYPAWVGTFAFSPDGKRIASGCFQEDAKIRIWDVAAESVEKELIGHEIGATQPYLAVQKVAFSPDGARLASCGGDGTVRIWDVKLGKELKTLHRFSAWSSGVAFSPDGKLLAAYCFRESKVLIFDLAADAIRHTWSALPGSRPCFAPDGRSLFFDDSRDQKIHEYDVITGKEKNAYPFEAWDRIIGLAVSPDGKTLAWSGGDTKDGTVRLRSLKPAKEAEKAGGGASEK